MAPTSLLTLAESTGPAGPAPVLRPVLPALAQTDGSSEQLKELWKVFSKVKDAVENGRRLENLSWRLWYKSAHLTPACAPTKDDRRADLSLGQYMERISLADGDIAQKSVRSMSENSNKASDATASTDSLVSPTDQPISTTPPPVSPHALATVAADGDAPTGVPVTSTSIGAGLPSATMPDGANRALIANASEPRAVPSTERSSSPQVTVGFNSPRHLPLHASAVVSCVDNSASAGIASSVPAGVARPSALLRSVEGRLPPGAVVAKPKPQRIFFVSDTPVTPHDPSELVEPTGVAGPEAPHYANPPGDPAEVPRPAECPVVSLAPAPQCRTPPLSMLTHAAPPIAANPGVSQRLTNDSDGQERTLPPISSARATDHPPAPKRVEAAPLDLTLPQGPHQANVVKRPGGGVGRIIRQPARAPPSSFQKQAPSPLPATPPTSNLSQMLRRQPSSPPIRASRALTTSEVMANDAFMAECTASVRLGLLSDRQSAQRRPSGYAAADASRGPASDAAAARGPLLDPYDVKANISGW